MTWFMDSPSVSRTRVLVLVFSAVFSTTAGITRVVWVSLCAAPGQWTVARHGQHSDQWRHLRLSMTVLRIMWSHWDLEKQDRVMMVTSSWWMTGKVDRNWKKDNQKVTFNYISVTSLQSLISRCWSGSTCSMAGMLGPSLQWERGSAGLTCSWRRDSGWGGVMTLVRASLEAECWYQCAGLTLTGATRGQETRWERSVVTSPASLTTWSTLHSRRLWMVMVRVMAVKCSSWGHETCWLSTLRKDQKMPPGRHFLWVTR